MNDIEDAITVFNVWDAEMDRMAKEKARNWCKDFSEQCVFIGYDTSLCKVDEVYLLTKVQTILLHADIVIDYTIEKSQVGGDYKWHVGVYLYDKDDVSDSDSDSESESDDPIAMD